MISLVSQLTQHNELYSVVRCKIQRNSIKVGKKKISYTNTVLSFQKYPLEIKKKRKKEKEHWQTHFFL